MPRQTYAHIQALLPEIRAAEASGKAKRKPADIWELRDQSVVKQLLARKCRKEETVTAGILPRPKGRPRKDAPPRDMIAEQAHEIERALRYKTVFNRFNQFSYEILS